MLPRTFGRLGRRTLISPAALASVVVLAAGGLIAITAVTDDEVAFLAALFSFGVLLAFAAAQLAVIRLRFTSPELERPYRVPWNVRIAGADVPIPAVVGLVLTLAVWVIAMVTHPGARYAGPIWLAAGLVVYGLVRRHRGEGLLERVVSPDEQAELAEPSLSKILVPMKLGLIGEEMIATAVKLAQERGSDVEALHVVRMPLSKSLDAPADPAEEERAVESLEEARLLGEDHGVVVRGSDGPRSLDRGGDRRSRRPSRTSISSCSARRRAGAGSRASSRPPSSTSFATLRARCSSSPSRSTCSRRMANLRPMKAVVIGCGRVGSASAKALQAEGWDVCAVDEKEEALQRLGENWTGGFVVGHGMDSEVLREAGMEEADAVIVATDGDNTNLVVAQIAAEALRRRERRRPRARSGPGDVLRHAGHADDLPDLAGDPRADRSRHDVRGGAGLMYIIVVGGGKVGANLMRSLIAMGHEVTLIEQRRDRFERLEQEFEHRVQPGDATELFVLEQAGITRPPDILVAATGDDEDNIIICQLAREKYGVPKVVARVNDPRNQEHFDLLGIAPTVCATSSLLALVAARGAGARARPPPRAAQGEPRDRRGADRRALAVSRQGALPRPAARRRAADRSRA